MLAFSTVSPQSGRRRIGLSLWDGGSETGSDPDVPCTCFINGALGIHLICLNLRASGLHQAEAAKVHTCESYYFPTSFVCLCLI